MKISIRSKLILAISLLIVVLFAATSYLFINEKKREITQDIFVNTTAFARLTAGSVASFYELYLAQNSFVYFNREMAKIFEQNDDVSEVKVISYDGLLLYDSARDKEKKYEGTLTKMNDAYLSEALNSENLSVKILAGKLVFLKIEADGTVNFVDGNEKPLDKISEGTLLEYILVPANEKYSVLYELDYHNLEDRLARMRERIIYLALFGVMLGMIMSFLMSTQVTKPVASLVASASEIAKGNFKTRVNIKTRDEMSFLGEAFNKMAQDLEVSLEAKVYKERVGRELELAAQIQDQLLPDQNQIPKIPSLDIAAHLTPAEEIGGDIYDFLQPDDKRLMMYVGDVTGHGVPAGIVSSISSALFYGYSQDTDLKNIILNVNRVLKVKTMPTMFLTLCLMEWNEETKKFSYVSAGHEQILHYRNSNSRAELMPAGGIALGMMKDISKHVNVNEVDLQSGEFLVIYSDGIPECWKNETDLYGFDRLKAIAEKSANLRDAVQIQDAILKDVKDFAAGYKQMDDITIMVIRRV